jgi:carbon storage regulator CsrA
MLVLSRRANEKIVFPSIGVTIHLLRINGKAVRIGIDAPPDLRVLREEVTDHAAPAESRPSPNKSATHELCNRLNKIALGLTLFQRQQEAGQSHQAEATLEQALNQLAALDRTAVSEIVEGGTAKTRRPRALLVEDDNNERELLSGLLGMNGCECATAADGDEALNYLAGPDRPDVVLLDMGMPRCDGPTALRAIRSNPRTADLIVFGVSGSSPNELGITTGPGGVDGWFAKPLNPRALWDAIKRCGTSQANNN